MTIGLGPEPAAVTDPEGAQVEFVRIGLASPAGRADLAVPASVALARLLPMLLRHSGADPAPDGGLGHGGWVLRRGDGTRLDAAASLAEQGVEEGDLLFLGHGTDDTVPPVYDDIVEVVGEHGVRAPWPAWATRVGAGALAALAVGTVAGALAVAPGRAAPGGLGLTVALLALAVGVLMSRGFGDLRAGTFAGVLAAPPAAVGAVRLLGGDGLTAGQLLLGCAVVAVVGGLGPVLIGGGDGTFAALAVAGPLAGVGAAVAAVGRNVTPAEAAAVAAPLALALTALWPSLALRVARVPTPQLAATAEDVDRLPVQLAHERLAERVAAARRLLGGLLVGSHLVAVGGALVLFAASELWAGVLGGTLTVLMLLRTRLFRESWQAATALVAALLAAAGGGAWTVADHAARGFPLLGVVLPVALVTAVVAGCVALAAGRYRGNPRLERALDVLETLLLVAVVPLVLAVWGVYGALLDLKV
ncbi:type VII secretion integral membrane protein EccD [Streptomyces profundus]|uniref:type VII secretion integral membrane protein EccD n=1 Tax=Streptomyces profundus TaxID=2867410 RepID=UPI001D16B427|nr:type VII secretion integral membrane protein EccD [Streptomyces sp. MA3_2.13]UED83397.1 type VII secretion integral membrane protein EccD [Streptomyces sp. MA3_2.13]